MFIEEGDDILERKRKRNEELEAELIALERKQKQSSTPTAPVSTQKEVATQQAKVAASNPITQQAQQQAQQPSQKPTTTTQPKQTTTLPQRQQLPQDWKFNDPLNYSNPAENPEYKKAVDNYTKNKEEISKQIKEDIKKEPLIPPDSPLPLSQRQKEYLDKETEDKEKKLNEIETYLKNNGLWNENSEKTINEGRDKLKNEKLKNEIQAHPLRTDIAETFKNEQENIERDKELIKNINKDYYKWFDEKHSVFERPPDFKMPTVEHVIEKTLTNKDLTNKISNFAYDYVSNDSKIKNQVLEFENANNALTQEEYQKKYNALTPEQKKIHDELVKQEEEKFKQRVAEVYERAITSSRDVLLDYLKQQNIPQDAFEYIFTKGFGNSIVGMLLNSQKSALQKQLEQQGLEEYGAGFWDELASTVLGLSIDAATGTFTVGGVAGGFASKVIMSGAKKWALLNVEKQVGKQVFKGIAAQTLPTVEKLVSTGMTSGGSFAFFDAAGEYARQTYQDEERDVLKIANRGLHGFFLGAVVGEFGLGTKALAGKVNNRLGQIAIKLGSSIPEAAIFITPDIISDIYNDKDIFTEENGKKFVDLTALMLAMKTKHFKETIKKEGKLDKDGELLKKLQFNKTDFEELNKAGIDGKNLQSIVKDLLRGNDTNDYHIKNVLPKIEKIIRDKNVPAETKSKLEKLFFNGNLYDYLINEQDTLDKTFREDILENNRFAPQMRDEVFNNTIDKLQISSSELDYILQKKQSERTEKENEIYNTYLQTLTEAQIKYNYLYNGGLSYALNKNKNNIPPEIKDTYLKNEWSDEDIKTINTYIESVYERERNDFITPDEKVFINDIKEYINFTSESFERLKNEQLNSIPVEVKRENNRIDIFDGNGNVVYSKEFENKETADKYEETAKKLYLDLDSEFNATLNKSLQGENGLISQALNKAMSIAYNTMVDGKIVVKEGQIDGKTIFIISEDSENVLFKYSKPENENETGLLITNKRRIDNIEQKSVTDFALEIINMLSEQTAKTAIATVEATINLAAKENLTDIKDYSNAKDGEVVNVVSDLDNNIKQGTIKTDEQGQKVIVFSDGTTMPANNVEVPKTTEFEVGKNKYTFTAEFENGSFKGEMPKNDAEEFKKLKENENDGWEVIVGDKIDANDPNSKYSVTVSKQKEDNNYYFYVYGSGDILSVPKDKVTESNNILIYEDENGKEYQATTTQQPQLKKEYEKQNIQVEDKEITEDIKPIGKGYFGNVYDQFKGRAKEAFNFLFAKKEGDLVGVFHKEGLGDIDLIWGSAAEDKGVEHIIEKHIIKQNDFADINEAAEIIDDVIKNGTITKETENRAIIEKDGYLVVVRKTIEDGQGNFIQLKNWILTSYDGSSGIKEKRVSASTDTTPTDNQGGRAVATDTQTAQRNNNDNIVRDKKFIENLPKDKDGNIDYSQIKDEKIYAEALKSEFEGEELGIIDELINEQKEKLSKADKKSIIERKRIEKEVNTEIDKLNKVRDILLPKQQEPGKEEVKQESTPAQQTKTTEKVRNEKFLTQNKINRERRDKIRTNSDLQIKIESDPELHLLDRIQRGEIKWLWKSKIKGTETIGMIHHYNKVIAQRLFGQISKDGFTLDRLTEDINDWFPNRDFTEIRNVVSDIAQMCLTKEDALGLLEKKLLSEYEENNQYDPEEPKTQEEWDAYTKRLNEIERLEQERQEGFDSEVLQAEIEKEIVSLQNQAKMLGVSYPELEKANTIIDIIDLIEQYNEGIQQEESNVLGEFSGQVEIQERFRDDNRGVGNVGQRGVQQGRISEDTRLSNIFESERSNGGEFQRENESGNRPAEEVGTEGITNVLASEDNLRNVQRNAKSSTTELSNAARAELDKRLKEYDSKLAALRKKLKDAAKEKGIGISEYTNENTLDFGEEKTDTNLSALFTADEIPKDFSQENTNVIYQKYGQVVADAANELSNFLRENGKRSDFENRSIDELKNDLFSGETDLRTEELERLKNKLEKKDAEIAKFQSDLDNAKNEIDKQVAIAALDFAKNQRNEIENKINSLRSEIEGGNNVVAVAEQQKQDTEAEIKKEIEKIRNYKVDGHIVVANIVYVDKNHDFYGRRNARSVGGKIGEGYYIQFKSVESKDRIIGGTFKNFEDFKKYADENLQQQKHRTKSEIENEIDFLSNEQYGALISGNREQHTKISQRILELKEELRNAKKGKVSFQVASNELEAVNVTFNNDVQRHIDGMLPKGHVYKLGTPKGILAEYIPFSEIELKATILEEKATKKDHDFDLSEIKDLPKKIANPLAIFRYGDKNKAVNIIIEVQKDGKNFIVGLSLNPMVDGSKLEIHSIRNIFPKENAEWLNWITQNKSMYLNKEKIQALITQQRTNLADVSYLNLEDVAKIVKNFDNTKFSEKNNENKIADQRKYSFDVKGITEANAAEMHAIKEKAIADGTFMKAPNGKKSNLNEREWLQVRTKKFIDWFGDWLNDPANASKVVDENGEPMKVYHGTQYAGHTIFEKKSNNFIYFTDKIYWARNYADEKGDSTVRLFRANDERYNENNKEYDEYDTKAVYAAFLNIRNPRYRDFKGKHALTKDFSDNLGKNDGLINSNVIDDNRHILDSIGNQSGTVFLISNSNQIKSATDNNGNFDNKSDDIRYQIERAKIDDVKNNILNLFKEAASTDAKGKTVPIGRLTEEGKKYLSDISGLDFKNYTDFALNMSDLRHIYNEHYGTNEKDKGNNIPLTDNDIKNILDVISNPEKILFLGKDNDRVNKFAFLRMADNGTYNLVEVYGKKSGQLTAKTFYKTKKGIEQRELELKKAPYLSTSETDGVLSQRDIALDTKIPQMLEGISDVAKIQQKNEFTDISEKNNEKSVERFKRIPIEDGKAITDHFVKSGVADKVTWYNGKDDPAIKEFSNKQEFHNQSGTVMGFRVEENGKTHVYLDSTKANANTPMHEFAGAYIGQLRKENHPIWQKAKELIKQSKYYEELKNNPNYKFESEDELCHEALEWAVGDNFEKDYHENKDKGFLDKVQDLLKEFWEWIGGQLGLKDLTPEQIRNLTLDELIKGIQADILRGENIKPETDAQKHFTTNPDRLPLTLSVFERPEFKSMRGKNVNPITIQQILNKTGIKAIEKQLINDVIDSRYKGQKSISYDELEAAVRASIIPLERIETKRYSDYGLNNLSDSRSNEDEYTVILNFPKVEHGQEGHFHGEFDYNKKRDVNYIAKQLDNNTWIAVEEDYQGSVNDNNVYNYVGTVGSKDDVEEWISNYENQDASFHINKGMYGHFRVWKDGGQIYIAEMQSDYFQNYAAKSHLIKETKGYSEIHIKQIESIRQINKEADDKIYEIQNQNITRDESKKLNAKIDNDRYDKIKEANKQFEKDKEALYEKLPPEEKQFIASQKVWERRLLHEAVREAVQSGADEVLFPTPHTIAVIENYVSGSKPYEVVSQLYDNRLTEGDIIEDVNGECVVSDVNWDGEFEAIPLENVIIKTTIDDYVKKEANYHWEDIRNEARDIFINLDKITRSEIENTDYGGYWDIAKEVILEKLYGEESNIEYFNKDKSEDELQELLDNAAVSLYDVENEIKDLIERDLEGRIDEDYFTKEFGFGRAVITSNYDIYVWKDSVYGENYKQPDKYGNVAKENFDPTELSETEQRVLEKYQAYEDLLKQDYGEENVSIYEDNDGYDWYRLELNKQTKNRPVTAFQKNNTEYNKIGSEYVNNIKENEYDSRNETELDNRRAMVDSATRELVGKSEEGSRIHQTLSESNSRGSEITTEDGVRRGWDKNKFLAQLEVSAHQNNVWIEDITSIAQKNSELIGGFENEPYLSNDGKNVIKLNNLNFLNDNDSQYETTRDFNYFIERLYSHNKLFPNVKYEIIGFGENSNGDVCIALKQPFVHNSKLATMEQVENWLQENGFERDVKPDGLVYYTNGKYELSDIKPQNVLVDRNGELYFIDLDIETVKNINKISEKNSIFAENLKKLYNDRKNDERTIFDVESPQRQGGNRGGEKVTGIDTYFRRVRRDGRESLEGGRETESEQEEVRASQERDLKEYAKQNNLLISEETIIENSSEELPKGKESRVFIDKNENNVIKITDCNYFAGETPLSFYDNHIVAFNDVFPNTAYKIVGFNENERGFCFVLQQPLIKGKRLFDIANQKANEIIENHPNKDNLTDKEISDIKKEQHDLQKKRVIDLMRDEFQMDAISSTDFTNDIYDVKDLHLKNVIEGYDGKLYVIDAMVKRLETDEEDVLSDFPPEQQREIRFQIAESAEKITELQENYDKEFDNYLKAEEKLKNAKTKEEVEAASIEAVEAKKNARRAKIEMQKTLEKEEKDLIKKHSDNTFDDVDGSKRKRNLFRRTIEFLCLDVYNFANSDYPMKELRDLVTKTLGGIYNDLSDTYNEISHSRTRVVNRIGEFTYNEWRNINMAIGEITKNYKTQLLNFNVTWKYGNDKKRKEGKPLTLREKIQVYLQAKDIEEADELKLVDRGRKGFTNDIGYSPEEYIEIFEKIVGEQYITNLNNSVKAATQFILDAQLKYGLITKEKYDELSKRKYYVPERGWQERDMYGNNYHFVKGGNYGYGNPFNTAMTKAEGRESLASNPLAYLRSIAETTILETEKNKVKQSMYRFVIDNLQIGADNKLFGFKKKYEPADYAYQSTKQEIKQHEVDVYIDGKKYTMYFTDDRVAAALNFNTSNNRGSGKLSKINRAGMSYLSAAATHYNIEFALTNLLRDQVFAHVTNTIQYGKFAKGGKHLPFEMNARLLKNTLPFTAPQLHGAIGKRVASGHSIKENNKYDKLVNEFFEDGANTGFAYLRSIENIKRQLENNTFNKVIEGGHDAAKKVLGFATEYTELLTRFGQYCALREAGYSRFQAATGSQNISINFNRAGANNWLAKNFLFAKASINALCKAVYLGKEYPWAFGAEAIAWGTAGWILNYFGGGYFGGGGGDDDEDTRYISDYNRYTNIIIGKTRWRLSQEVSVFYMIGVNLADAMLGKKTYGEAAFDAARQAVGVLSPVDFTEGIKYNDKYGFEYDWRAGAAANTPIPMLKPISEIAFNRNFMGKRIYMDRNPFADTTDPDIVKKVSKHLISAYTSGIGRLGSNIYETIYNAIIDEQDFDMSVFPVLNRFYVKDNPEGVLRKEISELKYDVKYIENKKRDLNNIINNEKSEYSEEEVKAAEEELEILEKEIEKDNHDDKVYLLDDYENEKDDKGFDYKEWIKKVRAIK